MNKMQLIKVTLLIVILAEEIKKVRNQKIKVKFQSADSLNFKSSYSRQQLSNKLKGGNLT